MMFRPLNLDKTSFVLSERLPFGLNDLVFMEDIANSLTSKRTRICLHECHLSIPQDMVIYFKSESRVVTSEHKFCESFTILSGSGFYRLYFMATSTFVDIPLSLDNHTSYFYLFIPSFLPHVFYPSTSVIVSETGFSNFSDDNSIHYHDSSLDSFACADLTSFNLNCFKSQHSTATLSIYFTYCDLVSAFSFQNLQDYLYKKASSLFLMPSTIPMLYDAILVLPPSSAFLAPSSLSIRTLQLVSGCPEYFRYHDATGSLVDDNSFTFFPSFSISFDFSILNTNSFHPLIIKFFAYSNDL